MDWQESGRATQANLRRGRRSSAKPTTDIERREDLCDKEPRTTRLHFAARPRSEICGKEVILVSGARHNRAPALVLLSHERTEPPRLRGLRAQRLSFVPFITGVARPASAA